MEASQDRPAASDPKQRFSDRVSHYVRYRPGYPKAVTDYLSANHWLCTGARVADIGSGTGISTELLLSAGATVVAVEPNDAMRQAAEERLGSSRGFESVNGSAEATKLPDESVALVTAGQSFHWFDRPAARAEFQRILRPGGAVALFWNTRLLTGSTFAVAYEALLHQYATDYAKVRHDAVPGGAIDAFFRPFPVQTLNIPSSQRFDCEGLIGRLLSSSFAPPANDPRHQPMLDDLQRLFDQTQVGGKIEMAYVTEVHAGRFK